MYKIAHISDLHISYKDEDGNGKKLVELLHDIKEKECDHVFITGDIVENPGEQDLHFVREILVKFDLMHQERLSIVPGNHDIFGGAYKEGLGSINFPLRCRNTDYEEKLGMFIEVFRETFPENAYYPYMKIMDNVTVTALNSVQKWSVDENPEGSNGYIETEDFLMLKKIFKKDESTTKNKIVILHHHLNIPELNDEYPAHSLWLKTINWKMKLHNRKALLKFLSKNKASIICHGHTHINEVYMERGITMVNSSACLVPLTDDGIRSYNLLYIPDKEDENEYLKIERVYI